MRALLRNGDATEARAERPLRDRGEARGNCGFSEEQPGFEPRARIQAHA